MHDAVDDVLAQWRAERPDLDASPMGVIGRIFRAQRRLEKALRDNFAAFDLQHHEFDILATLRREGAPFRMTAGALVKSSMVTYGAITNRIDRLEAKGLVTRRTDASNRRSVLIALTDKGLRLVDEAVERHVALEAELLSSLEVEDRERLAALLKQLLLGLGDGVTQEQ
ncbi:MarR family winged helix-turn-helix transcriptional regulator [Halomonas organivorans]|uniref:DNA-binding MarR family transcriptional regulator n=1 Tax=Halomonas organivorans TaxID=257772 RepID=A0A7W5BVA4_9GAMM|nr:MarR family transcriptional regulator [Halomonas organivorans]MBB3139796.1 DNA-binding MarR family transcriptional regulator [Halomonas organivorans]